MFCLLGWLSLNSQITVQPHPPDEDVKCELINVENNFLALQNDDSYDLYSVNFDNALLSYEGTFSPAWVETANFTKYLMHDLKNGQALLVDDVYLTPIYVNNVETLGLFSSEDNYKNAIGYLRPSGDRQGALYKQGEQIHCYDLVRFDDEIQYNQHIQPCEFVLRL